VRQASHRAGDLVVECGPAAAGVELVLGAVQGRVAAPADVGAGLEEVVVLAGEGRLRALELDDVALLRRQLVVLRAFHVHTSLGGALLSLSLIPEGSRSRPGMLGLEAATVMSLSSLHAESTRENP